jgi:hypothetical protein
MRDPQVLLAVAGFMAFFNIVVNAAGNSVVAVIFSSSKGKDLISTQRRGGTENRSFLCAHCFFVLKRFLVQGLCF